MTTTSNGQGYQEWESSLPGKKELVSLFIRAPDLGFLKPLYSKAQFFIFDPARKIRDTNENGCKAYSVGRTLKTFQGKLSRLKLISL
jgi:hypothetical protein